MLKKISVHPILSKDNSFKLFLESDNLQSEMQEKKGKSSFMSKFGDAVSFSGSFTKTTEVDDYFEQKRIYIDQMESQLKSVAKAIDGVIKNREG
jgi:sorting nexin-1/2